MLIKFRNYTKFGFCCAYEEEDCVSEHSSHFYIPVLVLLGFNMCSNSVVLMKMVECRESWC